MQLDFAKLNNQIPKFHVIIWANTGQSPSWTDNLSAADLETFMYQYVDKMAERYTDKDWPYIDVLNEYI